MRQAVIQKAEEKQRRQQPNLTGIPTQMKLDFEQRSGLSFDDVRVHYNSDKPRKIGALAYTQGTQVHIAPGQERHLRHELGHVVQQKMGIVRPSGKLEGRQINTNPQLEQQADSILDITYPLSHLDSRNSHEIHGVCQFEFDDYYSPYILLLNDYIYTFIQDFAEEKRRRWHIGDGKAEVEFYDSDDWTKTLYYLQLLQLDFLSSLSNKAEPRTRKITRITEKFRKRMKEINPKYQGLHKVKTLIFGILGLRSLTEANAITQSSALGDVAAFSRVGIQQNVDKFTQYSDDTKKGYLRKLEGSRDSKYFTDKMHDKRDTTHSIALLNATFWSIAVNDAYVGKIIDLGFYFRIDDISDKQKKKIEQISQCVPSSTAAYVLFKYAQTKESQQESKGLYSGKAGYTVLSREIALLLSRGYIFRCFDRREEKKGKNGLGDIKLLAFKDNTALTAYQEEYNRKHTPHTASEGDSSSTSPTLPEVKPVTT